MIHVSSISVGGIYPAGGEPLVLHEQELWIGQEIRNQYLRSKYMAEYELLRDAVDKGLSVKIMRVGNLQGRISDGEFQIKKKTNSFTRQLLSFAGIGQAPESMSQAHVNFSPVDEVAHMIIRLATLPDDYVAFHVYPPQELSYQMLFDAMAGLGHPVELVSGERFGQKLEELKQTEDGRSLVEGVLFERPDMRYRFTDTDNTYTEELLAGLGEKWSVITVAYLEKYLETLIDMQMI